MTNKDIMSQECLCGKADVQSADQATRIVGGKESVPDKHPWQAELYFDLEFEFCFLSCVAHPKNDQSRKIRLGIV